MLADNPGLKPRIGEAITRAYRRARTVLLKARLTTEEMLSPNCRFAFASE